MVTPLWQTTQSKGYTAPQLVEEYLQRPLTDQEIQRFERVLESVENFMDSWTQKPYAPNSTIIDEPHGDYRSAGEWDGYIPGGGWNGWLHLRHYPVANVLAVRNQPNGTSPTNDVTWWEFIQGDLQRGNLFIPYYIWEPYVWVTYIHMRPMPAEVRECATAITATILNNHGFYGPNLGGTTQGVGPLKSYQLGADINMQFATPQTNVTVVQNNGLRMIVPNDVYPMFMRMKRWTVA